MTDTVSFKAYLKRDGQLDEVRRFGIEGGAATNFLYLKEKIEAVFPSLRNDNFQVLWKDQDGDLVLISSDEELVVALTEDPQPLNRLYIKVQGPASQTGGPIHPNITCDGCHTMPVQGFRYKCLNCRDYDLCAKCEEKGLHSEHFMIRLPYPMNLRPHFARRFTRSPHRGHKEGKGNKHGKEHKYARFGTGMGCPMFSEQHCAQEFPFDWSAMSNFMADFIPSETQEMPHTSSSADNTQASGVAPNAQTSGTTPNAQSSGSANAQTSNQNQEDPYIRYVRTIGENIAAFLGPMGIDLKIDVHNKQNESGDAQPATTTYNKQQKSGDANPTTPPPTSNVQEPIIPPTFLDVLRGRRPHIESDSVNQPTETSPDRSRRPSLDGWTVLNRDLQSRSPSQPMEIDESRGAIPKQTTGIPATTTTSSTKSSPIESTPAPAPSVRAATAPDASNIYPSLPRPSAPTTPQDTLRQGIQEALEKIVSMGFDVDTERLQSLLQNENGNIAKVVEFLLSNSLSK